MTIIKIKLAVIVSINVKAPRHDFEFFVKAIFFMLAPYIYIDTQFSRIGLIDIKPQLVNEGLTSIAGIAFNK